MRCAPGYRHNDITGLIIGKPNRDGVPVSSGGEEKDSVNEVIDMQKDWEPG